MTLKKGINIIVPTYKAEKYITNLLNSLKDQTLDYNLFEAIFIINGERDNTENIIREFSNKNPEINIKITESKEGICIARNKGLEEVDREYIIYIDNDDYISPKYLEVLYKHRKEKRIVLGSFFNVDENTKEIKKPYFSDSLLKNNKVTEPNKIAIDAMFITTNKLIPFKYIKDIKFNEKVVTGEDIEYFSRVYAKIDFEFYIVNNDEEAIYYRLYISTSASHQDISYNFNVIERLNTMECIDKTLDNIENKKMEKIIYDANYKGQISFIISYLKKYPKDYKKVLQEIDKHDFKHFDYKKLNEDTIESLIKNIEEKNKEISYLKELNKSILNSRSWKITEPLRKIKNRK
ncbi:hypothetical protein BGI41_00405 [Methanobrevibacter sp. 87.7]|uniref:glycosyltransferase family 2 protein n=1 Tax=Methanobrevibacter sp. 87.7 TaxID=387957 RepID=UPI000B503EE7|nr:glycosyltransferase family 2 protein [Methanobrevibacter sp. 87.7]OWT33811.1 hypothetical protein BGI41_00405 [Methanobrevibacter sp. 87.7]